MQREMEPIEHKILHHQIELVLIRARRDRRLDVISLIENCGRAENLITPDIVSPFQNYHQ
jgi:hypothetical protein